MTKIDKNKAKLKEIVENGGSIISEFNVNINNKKERAILTLFYTKKSSYYIYAQLSINGKIIEQTIDKYDMDIDKGLITDDDNKNILNVILVKYFGINFSEKDNYLRKQSFEDIINSIDKIKINLYKIGSGKKSCLLGITNNIDKEYFLKSGSYQVERINCDVKLSTNGENNAYLINGSMLTNDIDLLKFASVNGKQKRVFMDYLVTHNSQWDMLKCFPEIFDINDYSYDKFLNMFDIEQL